MADVEELPPTPEHTEMPQYPIESVDNALRLLWLLSSRPSLRLTDASQYLDVASSTAHRLLAMLQYRGFVAKDPVTRAYKAGPSLDSLAFALLRRLNIRDQARPAMQWLNEQTQETVHLGTLEGATVRFVESIESPRAVRVASRVGRTLPAHCTSTGKAMLAQLEVAQLEVVYPNQELERLTAHSLPTRDELEKELATVRHRGYASSSEESEDGVCSIAVAIPGAHAPLALNVSVPINRMSARRRKELAGVTAAASTQIAALLN